MITPRCSKPSPNQAGDIYYSTVLRFVKRFREDFSIFLRSGIRTHPSGFHRQPVCFEENTGSKSNRYHIIYTQKPPLSSPKQKKYRKKFRHSRVCTREIRNKTNMSGRIHAIYALRMLGHAQNKLKTQAGESELETNSKNGIPAQSDTSRDRG